MKLQSLAIVSCLACLLFAQTESFGQAAFPLERIDDAADDQEISFDLIAKANDLNAGNGPEDVDEQAQNTTDTDYLNESLTATAIDGSTTTLSAGNATAETLPLSGTWAMVAEGTTSIGGAWSKTSPGTGAIRNVQSADSYGKVEILSSPDEPMRTSGIMRMQFELDASNGSFFHTTLNVKIRKVGSTGSYITVTRGMGGWWVAGVLENAGGAPTNVFEFVSGASLNKTYTASRNALVGDEYEVITGISAAIPTGTGTVTIGSDGVAAGSVSSLSTFAGFYVE
jgi:hypothetical protein